MMRQHQHTSNACMMKAYLGVNRLKYLLLAIIICASIMIFTQVAFQKQFLELTAEQCTRVLSQTLSQLSSTSSSTTAHGEGVEMRARHAHQDTFPSFESMTEPTHFVYCQQKQCHRQSGLSSDSEAYFVADEESGSGSGSGSGIIVFLVRVDHTDRVKELADALRQLNDNYVAQDDMPDIVIFYENRMPESVIIELANAIPRSHLACPSDPINTSKLMFYQLTDFAVFPRVWKKLNKRDGSQCGQMYHNGYKFMCRFWVHSFAHIPMLQPYRYGWRLDTDSEIRTPIKRSLFGLMKEKQLAFAYMQFQRDDPSCCADLGTIAQEWLDTLGQTDKLLYESLPLQDPLPTALFPDGTLASYNPTCSLFNTNFALMDMELLRTAHYASFEQHIDRSGGIYLNRWGDHIIHSLYFGAFYPRTAIFCARDEFQYHHQSLGASCMT
jgi:Glycolipid 2-alpha-mannosyltransferase